MNSVPVHKLQDRSSLGFQLVPFSQDEINNKRSKELGAHRDDHYIFFIMVEGKGSTIVDFEEKQVGARSMYYILPEQIHHRIRSNGAKGWFIAADPALVAPACRNVIESWFGVQEPISLSADEVTDYDQLLSILHRQLENEGRLPVMHSLLGAFFEMAANTIEMASAMKVSNSRPAVLSMQFKKLLHDNIRTYKSPADYAAMLHISEPYLNEALKKITGSTVSYWIKFTILTEAKRLLYFTDLNVKQIAADLGFDNHSYFSHLFLKETGMTALTFRKKFLHS